MAITVTAKPHSFVPAYNDIFFGATSSQTAQPNFLYYITVTVNGTTFIFKRPARPTSGDLVFNCRKCIEKALSQYYPFGLYGWQQVAGGILQVTVNIGERYGTTPVVVPGTNYQFYVWNGALEKEERRNYAVANYTFPSSLNQVPYLNKVKTNKDLTFYFLQQSVGTISYLEVKTYNSSGALLGTYQITNPFTTPSTANLYICINAGWTGLTNIDPSNYTVITGSSPIITSNVSYYDLKFTEGDAEKNYRVQKCECCSDNKTLFYLNRYGAFDPINFCGNSRSSVDINKTYYKGIDNYFEGSYLNASNVAVIPSNPLDINKRVLSNTNEGKQQLVSDYLTDEEVTRFAECWKASKHFLQHDTANYQIVVQDDNTFAFKKGRTDKLIQFIANISDGFVNRRQQI